ncbi:hypothetical protein ACHAXH_002982 [Discostella pseudostelligera]
MAPQNKESSEDDERSPQFHDKSHIVEPADIRAKVVVSAHSLRTETPTATTTLCILVVIDMFAVALVVPLLHQYYQNAGIHSASQREILSSLFSSSQIVGGLVIGALSDLGLLSRRRILFLSFVGSAISYTLVVGGLRQLIFSRVLVGLVKQTMTVSTSLLVTWTTPESRAVCMGRLSASTTFAWITGPSVGALLYKHVSPSAPAFFASGLFVLNSVLAAVLLPANDEAITPNATTCKSVLKDGGIRVASLHANLKTCFSSCVLASVVISLVLYGWVVRTTSYSNMASFYEEKYGIEPHFRGYIKSYQQLLGFLVQSFCVRALLTASGGERRSTCIGAVIMAVATLGEVNANFGVFVSIVCPAVAIADAMIGVSLRSLVTQVSPNESIGSVLAALDVLQNAASVTVPFYRTILFKLAMYYGSKDDHASMAGDPEPKLWLVSSFVHWSLLALAQAYLLLPPSPERIRILAKKNR